MAETYQRGDWYRAPLWYDIVFGADTELEADFLEAVRVKHGRSHGRRAFEPACGTGRLLIELAARGWTCDGFDAEPAMVEFASLRAQQEGVRRAVRVWEARMESFALPGKETGGYDLAFSLLSTFKYLKTEAAAAAFLRGVSDRLEPGGIFVLGTHLADYSQQNPEHERWVGERDGVRVVCNTRTWPADPDKRLEPMRNRLRVTQDGEPAACIETLWEVRSYTAEELASTLRTSAPELALVATYDFSYDSSSPLGSWDETDAVVLVLRKTPC